MFRNEDFILKTGTRTLTGPKLIQKGGESQRIRCLHGGSQWIRN